MPKPYSPPSSGTSGTLAHPWHCRTTEVIWVNVRNSLWLPQPRVWQVKAHGITDAPTMVRLASTALVEQHQLVAAVLAASPLDMEGISADKGPVLFTGFKWQLELEYLSTDKDGSKLERLLKEQGLAVSLPLVVENAAVVEGGKTVKKTRVELECQLEFETRRLTSRFDVADPPLASLATPADPKAPGALEADGVAAARQQALAAAAELNARKGPSLAPSAAAASGSRTTAAADQLAEMQLDSSTATTKMATRNAGSNKDKKGKVK